MKGTKSLALAAIVGFMSLLTLSCYAAGAKLSSLPAQLDDLAPEEQHAKASRLVTSILAKYHYIMQEKDSGVALDDALSARVLEHYFKILDPNRIFFSAKNVEPYQQYQKSFDDFLIRGDLSLAYNIYEIFRHRWLGRYAYAIDLLDTKFDFTKDESIQLDRDGVAWAGSEHELEAFWRKKVKSDLLNLLLAGKEEDEAKDVLRKRYQRAIKRMEQTHSEDVFQEYMNAFAKTLDPHTNYFSPRNYENFNIDMKLSLEGIGAVLNIEDEHTKIVKLVPGGPASKTKQLHPGDKIVGVAQGSDEMVDVIGWRLDDVVDLIRGKKGSTVRLEILGAKAGAAGKTKIVAIVRDQVKLEEQAAKSKLIELDVDGKSRSVGVIDIPKFYRNFAARSQSSSDYRSVTHDVKKLISELKEQNIEGLIIDLRNNGGGALSEASALTGLFIDKGPVVQIRGASGRVQVEYDTDKGVFYNGPLVVLVNGFSASASEIFAAAIQDYGRGIVVGSPTFGKGTVQTIEDLNNYAQAQKPFGQVKFTTAKFYRINGGSTQNKGVIPDIEFPSFYAQDEYGESALDYAMPWDHMRKLTYRPVGDLSVAAQSLLKQHEDRIEGDQEFQFIIEDIDALKARKNAPLSLNMEQRKKLRNDDDVRRLERENYRRKLEGLKPYASLEDFQAVEEEQDSEDVAEQAANEEEEKPDPFVDEAARILFDFVDMNKPKSSLAKN
tara:strand:- start:12094 stop:14253 length:2160 start_codon:yes stop_codon:yes gene_type:complete